MRHPERPRSPAGGGISRAAVRFISGHDFSRAEVAPPDDGLQPLRNAAVVPSSRMPDLITIGNYTFLSEAELARGILDDAGIESVLIDDNMGRMLGWNVVGGFKLQVNKDNADAAIKLLSTAGSAAFAPPRCPGCGSFDLVLQETAGPAAYTGASSLTPVEIHEQSWECKSCGFCWDNSAGM
jgi:hypothetical protein